MSQELIEKASAEDLVYEYTIQSYLKNPVGAGAATTPGRKVVLETLEAKYRRILSDHHGRFPTSVYKVGDSVLVHVRVPSETVEGVLYDVCVEFTDAAATDSSLLSKKITVFSNSPSFVYTYAYVLNKRGLLTPFLRPTLPAEALEEAPSKRNPDETVNYEKTIVYAIYYIMEKRLFLRENFGPLMTVSNKISVKAEFPDFDDLVKDYEHKKALQSKKKADEKKERKAKVAEAAGQKKQARRAKSAAAAAKTAIRKAAKKG